MKYKIISIIEIGTVFVAIAFAALWMCYPEKNIEPLLVFISFLLIPIDFYRRKSKKGIHENKVKMASPKKDVVRKIDFSHHLKFIESLPDEKMVAYENAQQKWDSGITTTMREGNHDVISFLEGVWLKLSEFYPSNNFEGKDSKIYIKEYIQNRFDYHCSKHTPGGEFKGGTMVHVMIGGDVISDLNDLIVDLVVTISLYNDSFDFKNWKKRWNTP